MKIFKRLKKMFAQGETKGYEILVDPTTQSSSGVNVNAQSILTYSPIWYAVCKIAGHIGQMPICLKQRSGEEVREVPTTEYPSMGLLKIAPNPLMTIMDMMETAQHHAIISGNGRVGIYRDRAGRPSQLFPIHPDYCWTFLSYEEAPQGWGSSGRTVDGNTRLGAITPFVNKYHRFTTWDGQQFIMHDNDVIHIRGLQTNGVVGIPLWQVARDSVGAGLSGQEQTNKLLTNGVTPGIILEAPEGVLEDEEEQQEFINTFNQVHAGSERAGKPLVLPNAITAKSLTFSSRDAQMLESRRFSRLEAADWTGVEQLLGIEESQTYANLSQKNAAYKQNTLARWTVKIEQELTRKFLPAERIRRGYYIELDLSAILRGSPEERFNVYRIGREIGTYSEEDTRRMEGMNAERTEGEHYGNPSTTPGDPAGESDSDVMPAEIVQERLLTAPVQQYSPLDHHERDAWIYEQHAANLLSIQQIMDELAQTDWDIVTSEKALRNASHKYADFHGLPRIDRRNRDSVPVVPGNTG